VTALRLEHVRNHRVYCHDPQRRLTLQARRLQPKSQSLLLVVVVLLLLLQLLREAAVPVQGPKARLTRRLSRGLMAPLTRARR